VHFIWQGIRQAITLLLHPTADLRSILSVTLQLALYATLVALVIGLPIGLTLGLGRFRGRRLLLAVANAGLGAPPVVVGLVVSLLMFRQGPLGPLRLIYTLRGMVIAQSLLSIPIVISVTAAAVQSLDDALLAQARVLGASRLQLGAFALREARTSVYVAAIGAVGSALSEVGAVVLVGGNIDGQTRTAAGAILTTISAGRYGEGIALGVILLGLLLILAAGLTLAQQGVPRGGRVRSLAFGGR
jgi:tungstate transport system permease protein